MATIEKGNARIRFVDHLIEANRAFPGHPELRFIQITFTNELILIILMNNNIEAYWYQAV